jgi:hypothetical protein
LLRSANRRFLDPKPISLWEVEVGAGYFSEQWQNRTNLFNGPPGEARQ